MLNFALDRERIESNPAARIEMPVEESPRERTLSDDEIRRFWTAPLRDPQHNVMKLCLIVGVRIGEAAGLSPRDITDGVWRLPDQKTKDGGSRDIPMPRLALDHVNGEPVSESSVHQAWRRYRKKAGLDDVGSHDQGLAFAHATGVALDRLVAVAVAQLLGQVLPDPFGGQPLLELLDDGVVERGRRAACRRCRAGGHFGRV